MPTELNENQLLAAQQIATGEKAVNIAKALGVRPETLSRWRQMPAFIAKVNQIISDAQSDTQARLSALSVDALELIEETIKDPDIPRSIRLRAAFKVIDSVRAIPELKTSEAVISNAQFLDSLSF